MSFARGFIPRALAMVAATVTMLAGLQFVMLSLDADPPLDAEGLASLSRWVGGSASEGVLMLGGLGCVALAVGLIVPFVRARPASLVVRTGAGGTTAVEVRALESALVRALRSELSCGSTVKVVRGGRVDVALQGLPPDAFEHGVGRATAVAHHVIEQLGVPLTLRRCTIERTRAPRTARVQ